MVAYRMFRAGVIVRCRITIHPRPSSVNNGYRPIIVQRVVCL